MHLAEVTDREKELNYVEEINVCSSKLEKQLENNNLTEAVVTAEYLRHLRQGHLTELKNAVCELCLSAKGSKRPHKKVNEFKPTRDRQIVFFDTIGKIAKDSAEKNTASTALTGILDG